MGIENGTLAKLGALRLAFLTAVEEARSQFVRKIKEARENYISQVVDVTLSDPELSEVEKALSAWNTPNPLPRPTIQSAATGAKANTLSDNSGLVPIGQSGVAEKFPMKTVRGLTVYGRCPSCNSYILEAEAKFCSRCAYPLEGEL